MVRMSLEPVEGIEHLKFDLGQRTVDIFHQGPRAEIGEALGALGFGATEVECSDGEVLDGEVADADAQRSALAWALAINATLFCTELVAGLLSGSMGLVADSLDMLADALVYTLSLVAVGGSASRKKWLAAASGYTQLALAIFGLVEVTRRFFSAEGPPEVWAMVAFSLVALAANMATLWLLRRTPRGEAHIEASWIFTSNDVQVNLLVIVAGLLVWWTSSRIPDLVVGGLIFLIVANGSRRIITLARAPTAGRP